MKRTGINAAYVPFFVEPERIGHAMESLRTLNIAGANITVPYKEQVIPHLDLLSEGARIIGAVNTIVCKGNTLKGYNTNAIGVMDALESFGIDVSGKRALVFGTGGAARAVVFILNWLRADTVFISGRNLSNAEKIAGEIGGTPLSIEKVAGEAYPIDIVVNATSVSSPDESPEMESILKSLNLRNCRLIFDLNYGHRQNIWQQTAAARKLPFQDGFTPLAFQARRTFTLWTGMEVPKAEFLTAMEG